MRSACLAAAFSLCLVGAARAEAPTARLFLTRSFGFFVGDLVRARVDIVAGEALRLQAASLPRPGPVTNSLDLREVEVKEEAAVNGVRRWRLELTYQLFYVALDVRDIGIPPFSVRFADGAETETVETPAWKIGVSPLREVLPEKREDPADYMRPDSSVARIDETSPLRWSAVLGAATSAALALLARDRGWPPFRRRRARIFAVTARRIALLERRGEGEATRLDALLLLHRAIDGAAGRRVFAEDLGGFLSDHPEYDSLRAALEQFFTASRAAFFNAPNARRDDLALPDILSLARRLAACERTAP